MKSLRAVGEREKDFMRIREQMVRGLKNFKKDNPYSHCMVDGQCRMTTMPRHCACTSAPPSFAFSLMFSSVSSYRSLCLALLLTTAQAASGGGEPAGG
jgi:hypothetical protein